MEHKAGRGGDAISRLHNVATQIHGKSDDFQAGFHCGVGFARKEWKPICDKLEKENEKLRAALKAVEGK